MATNNKRRGRNYPAGSAKKQALHNTKKAATPGWLGYYGERDHEDLRPSERTPNTPQGERIKKTKKKMSKRFDPNRSRDLGGSGDTYPNEFDELLGDMPKMTKKSPVPRAKKKGTKKKKVRSITWPDGTVTRATPKTARKKAAKAKADSVRSRMGKDIKGFYDDRAPTKKSIEEQPPSKGPRIWTEPPMQPSRKQQTTRKKK